MLRSFFLFLATIVTYVSSDVSELQQFQIPSTSYGTPSQFYGQPLSSYGVPQSSILSSNVESKAFQNFGNVFPSVTPPSAEFRLPEVRTSVDFLSPFSTTQNSLDVGGSSTIAPPIGFGQEQFAAVNIPQQSHSFNYLQPNNFGQDVSSTTFRPFQDDSVSEINNFKSFNFNVPSRNNFGSPGFDFSAFSTPKPIISEYSNIGINNVPSFNTANLFNNDALVNSVSFSGKTSGGALTDAFGVPSSTVSPVEDSIANLPSAGGVEHQSQNVEVSKHLYFFAAPEEPEEQAQPKVHVPTGPAKKNYKIIFIKTPEFKPAAPVSIPALPQNEEKTLIYVLQKKPTAPGDIEVHTPPPTVPPKPEVFFIKYKTEKDAQEAVSHVQEAHAAGQVVNNQEILARFGQNNGIVPQSFDNINEYKQILANFGTSTPAPVGFEGFGSRTSNFGTSTISPLASFTSTFAPNFGFGQNTFESSSQAPIVPSNSGLESFKFGQNFFETSSQSPFAQNVFSSSTPSPLIGDSAFKSFDTVSSTAAPSLSGFESSSSLPAGFGSFNLGVTSAPSFAGFKSFESSTSSPLGFQSFESVSSSAAPVVEGRFNFDTSTPSPVSFKGFETGISSNVAPSVGSFNLGQTSFDTSTASPGSFKNFEAGISSNVAPGVGSFNFGQTSFDTSTPSPVSFKGFEAGISSNVAPGVGSFNFGQTSFDTSTASPVSFKGFEAGISSNVAPGVDSFNFGQTSFDSSTASPVSFKSFEAGISSNVAPGFGGFESFGSSTPSSVGFKSFEGFSSTVAPAVGGFESSSAGSLGSLGGFGASVEQNFGGQIPVKIEGSSDASASVSTTASSLGDISSSSVSDSSTEATPVKGVEESDVQNEIEESGSEVKEETASASSPHAVYGPPKE